MYFVYMHIVGWESPCALYILIQDLYHLMMACELLETCEVYG